MHSKLFTTITEMLSQLTQMQEDLINLKQQIIEIEMSSEATSPQTTSPVQTLPF